MKPFILFHRLPLDPFMGSVYDLAEAETFPSVTSSTITQVKVDKENGYELKQNSETLGWISPMEKIRRKRIPPRQAQ